MTFAFIGEIDSAGRDELRFLVADNGGKLISLEKSFKGELNTPDYVVKGRNVLPQNRKILDLGVSRSSILKVSYRWPNNLVPRPHQFNQLDWILLSV
jgi:hypothetical protein